MWYNILGLFRTRIEGSKHGFSKGVRMWYGTSCIQGFEKGLYSIAFAKKSRNTAMPRE